MDHPTGLIRTVGPPVGHIRRLTPISRLEIATPYIPGYFQGTVESSHTDFLEVRPFTLFSFFFLYKK